MIPDIYWSEIPLGFVTLQVWGLFVAAGIVTALVFSKKEAVRQKLNGEVVFDVAFWIILGALIGARLYFVITELQLYIGDWLGVLRVWEGGMSITGGFIGAVLAAYIYLKKKGLSFWRYAEVIVMYLPLGLFIGRLGCFFIFDHPGIETDFILGEEYHLDGLIRHNHGLYLSLNGLAMFSVFMFLKKKYTPKPPFFSIIFLLWYGIFRLIADFSRILDATFYGLTAAQWSAILMIIGSIVLFGQRSNIRKLLKKS